ncbi:MAG: hypothetical protein QXK24_07270 [Ignisphaera sp.]
MNTTRGSVPIKVKLFGLGDKGRILEVVVQESSTIRDIVAMVVKGLTLEIDYDEVMVLCNEVQLYPDDMLPKNCTELEFFPLALGG